MRETPGDRRETIAPPVRLQRFTPSVTGFLVRINTALEVIRTAKIWPASAEALRFSAQVGTIHYSTLLEGNRLSTLEAKRAVRGDLDAGTKAEIELVNYVDAINLIDDRLKADGLILTEDLFLEVHREMTKGLGTDEGHLKPHHEGAWRDGEAAVFDPVSQQAVHEGCPQQEVQPRMAGLVRWIREVEARPDDWPPHVVAGIVHHVLTDVHPFADGNGRVARLMTSAVLLRHDLIPGKMFNFDRFYGIDRDRYLEALRSFQNGNGSHEEWTRYFLEGMAIEYERVRDEVSRLSEIGSTRGGDRVQLTVSQQEVLTVFAIEGIREFRRKDYERTAAVASTKAGDELKILADSGVLDRIGSGPNSRYRFSSATLQNPWTGGDRRGPKRKWTDDRIEDELRQLVGATNTFPPVKAFKDQGKWSLYLAIQKYGGTGGWSKKLGLNPKNRDDHDDRRSDEMDREG